MQTSLRKIKKTEKYDSVEGQIKALEVEKDSIPTDGD